MNWKSKHMIRPVFALFIAALALLFANSCKISYSFTGADIPIQAKTFSVRYFQNNASLVQPMLSQKLTEGLRDRMLQQTSLLMVNSGGDIAFEGEITNYLIQPVAIQGNETAQLTQLLVTVNVRFFNKISPDKNYESNFSRFQQFSSSLSLAAVEDNLMDQITEDLVDDIFNKALVNW
jgi:hypothetical protein